MSCSPGHKVNRKLPELLGLVALAAVSFAVAGVGVAYVAGFGKVHLVIASVRWWWLVASVCAVAVAFVGYLFAYRGVKRVEGGPELEFPALLAVVAAGFGGFLAHGGTVTSSRCGLAG